jgi:glycosyltransferase involved in cell wall biosynthesis
MDSNNLAHGHSNMTNSRPLISMMMPVFNGQNFIRHSIEALLRQDYENIELIILDNLSTDDTRIICEEYAKQDSRVRYICDETPCISHEAANRLIKYVNGEYCMIACDDDLYAPGYVRKMLDVLLEDGNIGMAYSRMESVDIYGNILKTRPEKLWFTRQNSLIKNFLLFLWIRSCVPMVFGLFRTDLYRQTLPFQVFDKTLYDADNKFMLEFLAVNKVHCVDETLFYYRSKDRIIEKEGSTDKKSRESAPDTTMGRFVYLAKHQVLFTREIYKVIDQSNFDSIRKFILKAVTFFSFLYFLINLIPFLHRLIYIAKAVVKRFFYFIKRPKINSISTAR